MAGGGDDPMASDLAKLGPVGTTEMLVIWNKDLT